MDNIDQQLPAKQYITAQQLRRNLKKVTALAWGSCLIWVGLLGGAGYWLDSRLDKRPLWTIIGCGLAFIAMNITVVYLTKRLITHDQTTTSSSREEVT